MAELIMRLAGDGLEALVQPAFWSCGSEVCPLARAAGSLGTGAALLLAAAVLIAAYLLGNISPATLIARARGIDIKTAGSGNAGTTNAARVLGGRAAVATLVIDIGKGALAVLLGRLLGGELLAMAAVLPVMLGHIWPVFLRFRGGKGVATAFGALVMLCPAVGLGDLALVAIGLLISRRMSVGSLVGYAANPILAWIFLPHFTIDALLMSLIVLGKHSANIRRLVRGEEPPFRLGGHRESNKE